MIRPETSHGSEQPTAWLMQHTATRPGCLPDNGAGTAATNQAPEASAAPIHATVALFFSVNLLRIATMKEFLFTGSHDLIRWLSQ
jgi:hypothetical protein